MIRITIAIVFGACLCLLPGCPGDDDDSSGDDDVTGDDDTGDDDATGDDDTTPETFEIAGDGLYPADGATDAYYRAPILVRFTTPADTATLEMTDGDTGDPVDGTTTMTPDGRQVVFQPAAPLAREHGYLLSVAAAGGDGPDEVGAEWEIGTSSTGGPLDHPQLADERAYLIDLSQARFVDPVIPTEFVTALEGGTAIVGITSSDLADGTINAIGGSTDLDTGDPYYCDSTIEFPPAEFLPTEEPFVQLGPVDLVFRLDGVEMTIFGVVIRGTFTSAASALDGARLSGMLDTAGLEQLMEAQGTPCELLETVAGVSCEACPDDGAQACVPVDMIELDGRVLEDPLYPVSDTQTENHLCGNCEDGLDNDGDGILDDNEFECHSDVWP